jgi:hypothetical protein
MIRPGKPRSTVSDESDELRINIPARRHWLLVIFLAAWLCGWAVGEIAVLSSIVYGVGSRNPPPPLFLVVWLIGWTVGGGFAIYAVLWQLIGKQVILVNPVALTIRDELGRPIRSRQFDLGQVRDLRASQVAYNPWDYTSAMQVWGIGGGAIAFDYGAKTYRFGSGLDEAEAKHLVKQITQRFPIRAD